MWLGLYCLVKLEDWQSHSQTTDSTVWLQYSILFQSHSQTTDPTVWLQYNILFQSHSQTTDPAVWLQYNILFNLIPRPLTLLSGYITSYSNLIPRPQTPHCIGEGLVTIQHPILPLRGGAKMPELFPSQTSSGTCIASSITQY